METLSRKEWDAMSADQQYSYAYWQTWSNDQYEGLLEMIPECPVHGKHCIPHATEWILSALRELKAQDQHIREIVMDALTKVLPDA